ncbi:hypothetical protein [uncultured Croceitalea sp.]|uniref:hypothetical protein n=1 Tax=uncultured Croceitalea sp. TaxID=1798908 RepID=UPI003305AC54
MRTIFILTFLLFGYLGNSQLIDPFGENVTHEIKLTKLDDGAYMGAMEWTTGGVDSLQRFVVKNLSVKAPVMVRIISKAPDHNIDVSFHKSGWDKIESKVSTAGDKFVDKIFRTMNTAGIGVSSEVAGIPYLIIIKVGLQFPSTKSLIRVTDDLEEYNRHLKKLGIAGSLSNNNDSTNGQSSTMSLNEEGGNTHMYIIIGLLVLIIVLLALFLMRKQKSKTTLVLWFAMCFSAYSMAQSNVPKPVPVGNPNGSPVFVEYRTSNIANQTPVPITTGMNSQEVKVVSFNDDGTMTTRAMRIDVASGAIELTGEKAAEVLRRIKEANEEFDRQYRENMPGEPTEGDQRVPPADQTREELEQLRRQVRRLQRQVDLLSQEDEEYDEEEDDQGEEILLYCEDIKACKSCINRGIEKFNNHLAYWNHLQHFYLSEVDELNDKIEYGNTLASMPGFGIAWGPILTNVIRPAMNNLKRAYNKKFNEYILSIEADFESISNCYQGPNGRFRTNNSYEIQAVAIINSLKAARINK